METDTATGPSQNQIEKSPDLLFPQLVWVKSRQAIINTMQTLYTDGGCSNNGQLDISKRWMISVVTDGSGIVVKEQEACGGSNNIAELIAVSLALDYAHESGWDGVKIITDSKNNLAWVNGRKVGKKINDREAVLALKEKIRIRREEIDLRLVWQPRETNLAGHYIEMKHGL